MSFGRLQWQRVKVITDLHLLGRGRHNKATSEVSPQQKQEVIRLQWIQSEAEWRDRDTERCNEHWELHDRGLKGETQVEGGNRRDSEAGTIVDIQTEDIQEYLWKVIYQGRTKIMNKHVDLK